MEMPSPADKNYPGDNRLISPRVHIDGEVWHLDVGSFPSWERKHVPAGWAVRPLKRYASWVQNVVRQFGLIRRGAGIFEICLSTKRGPGKNRW